MSRKTTRQLIPLKQSIGDEVDEDYGILCRTADDKPVSCRVAVVVLSLLHIILALASIALGVSAICTAVTGYYIGYGVWCGLIFLLTGIITWVTGYQSCINNGMVTTSLVFNIVSSCAAAVQFSLGIVAATNDRLERNDRLSDATLTDVNRYDFYHSKLAADWLPCDSHFDWPSWAAVDILLVIVAGCEAFVAIFAAALACRSICSGRLITDPIHETPPHLIQNDYPGDGYGGGTSTLAYVNPAYTR